MAWSLYKNEGKENQLLKPLVFSNGKSQENIVNEVLSAVKEGHKIIFIRGGCGTGKSAIALNIAKELGKSSIVVPGKALQKQYEDDYTNKKYLLKNDGQRLKIKVIAGRANFPCPYLQEEKFDSEEKDSKLDDFSNLCKGCKEHKEYQSLDREHKDVSCDNPLLPCKIEIKEKNIKRLKEYLKKNPNIDYSHFKILNRMNLDRVKRLSIAPICPYWSPIVPSEVDLGILRDARCKKYTGLNGKQYTIYKRMPGCGYYDQYESYTNADTIIFNSQKYKLETVMNRKPETEIEIIDECDEFLDSFSNSERISLNRLSFALSLLYADNEKNQKAIDEISKIVFELMNEQKIKESIAGDAIINLKDTSVMQLLRLFLDSEFMDHVECDDENYCYHCEEVARVFEDFLDETYVSFHKEDRDTVIRLVTTDLKKKFKELLEKNKVLVLMSGTIHSETVLREIFGLPEFKVIEAETKMPGKITKIKTGFEINCKYANFRTGLVSRKQYLAALSRCINIAPKPMLIHVTSFEDLPSEQEAALYGLNVMTRERLKEMQMKDKMGDIVKRFKNKEIEALYTTKCNRGVDFPGNICNSIILTRYPYPNISSIFWRVLKKTNPQHFHSFYMDKAKREFLQRIYRGLRSESDHVYLLSPDIRVFTDMSIQGNNL